MSDRGALGRLHQAAAAAAAAVAVVSAAVVTAAAAAAGREVRRVSIGDREGRELRLKGEDCHAQTQAVTTCGWWRVLLTDAACQLAHHVSCYDEPAGT